MSWQDDKSWSEIDEIIRSGKDREVKDDKNKPHSEIDIPIYNSDENKFSLWGFLKKIFGKKDQ